jgi:hypothetical protein
MERQFKFEEVSLAELRAVEGGSIWGWIKDAAGWVYDHASVAVGWLWGMVNLNFRF